MSNISDDWKEKYNALVLFGNEHGHCNATYRHSIMIPGHNKPFKLGCFVVVQRKDYAAGKLDPEKVELLNKLVEQGKFEWAPTTVSVRSDRTWPLMFQALHEFCSVAQRKPVTSIPENLIYRDHGGNSIKLGRWMHTQNKLHRNGKLRQDRILRFHTELINVGLFCWPVTRGTRNSFANKQQQQQQNMNHIYGMDVNQNQQLMNGHNMLSSDPSLLLNKNNLHPLSGEVSAFNPSGLSLTAHAVQQARIQQQHHAQQQAFHAQQQYVMNNMKMQNDNVNNMMHMSNMVSMDPLQYSSLNVLSGVLGGHNGLVGLDDDSSVSSNEGN